MTKPYHETAPAMMLALASEQEPVVAIANWIIATTVPDDPDGSSPMLDAMYTMFNVYSENCKSAGVPVNSAIREIVDEAIDKLKP